MVDRTSVLATLLRAEVALPLNSRCGRSASSSMGPAVPNVDFLTLVTLGRLTDVSLNKNGGSREAVKNKGSVWVEGERIRSPFLARRKMTQKPNHSRNKFSLHLISFEIFEIQNPVN